jgi:hypothetical protein
LRAGPGRREAGNRRYPTISCINIRRLPQALGHFGLMWYLASAAFDRHT